VEVGDNWSLVGTNATEVLYMSDGITMIAQHMPFFLITDVSAKDGHTFPFEGILGLSPNVQTNNYSSLG